MAASGPRTHLKLGSVNLFGSNLCLCSCLHVYLCSWFLPLFLPFFSLRAKFCLFWSNSEERSILILCVEIIPFESFAGPGSLSMVSGVELLVADPPSKPIRGGGGGESAAAVVAGSAETERLEGMPIGRERSRGEVRLRSVSGTRREGGRVFPRGAGASGALVLVLEVAGCGRRATPWRRRPVLLPTLGHDQCWISGNFLFPLTVT